MNIEGRRVQALFFVQQDEKRAQGRPALDVRSQRVTHLKSRVTFNILTDDISIPRRDVPPEIAPLLMYVLQYLSIISKDGLFTN